MFAMEIDRLDAKILKRKKKMKPCTGLRQFELAKVAECVTSLDLASDPNYTQQKRLSDILFNFQDVADISFIMTR